MARRGLELWPNRLRVGCGSHLRTLARNVVRQFAEVLDGGELGNHPSQSAPRLAVVASAKEHDGPFRERVDVVATGSSDCRVQFDLGRLRTSIRRVMTIRYEDWRRPRGAYLGHHSVDPVDAATGRRDGR